MPDATPSPDGLETHPTVRRERTDVNFWWILGLVIAAGVAGVVIHFAILWFFYAERGALDQARQSRFPLAETPPHTVPPEPRLEQIDRLAENQTPNLFLRESAKLDVLNGYGPTREKGYVHIPVERAIKLLANKLPARDPRRSAAAVTAARTVGLLLTAEGGPLAGVLAAAPLGAETVREALAYRQHGLVGGGEPNSGRMFNSRRLRWLGP